MVLCFQIMPTLGVAAGPPGAGCVFWEYVLQETTKLDAHGWVGKCACLALANAMPPTTGLVSEINRAVQRHERQIEAAIEAIDKGYANELLD